MMDRLLPLASVAALLVFLGILAWKVPSPDLWLIVAITLLLVLWDMFGHTRKKSRRP